MDSCPFDGIGRPRCLKLLVLKSDVGISTRAETVLETIVVSLALDRQLQYFSSIMVLCASRYRSAETVLF